MKIITVLKQLFEKKLTVSMAGKEYNSKVTYTENDSLQYCHLITINDIVIEVLHSKSPTNEAMYTLYYQNKPFYKELLVVKDAAQLKEKIIKKTESLKGYFTDAAKGLIEKITIIIGKKLKGADYKDGYLFYYYVDKKNDKHISYRNNAKETSRIDLPDSLTEEYMDNLESYNGEPINKYMKSNHKYYDKFNCNLLTKVIPLPDGENPIYLFTFFNAMVKKDVYFLIAGSESEKTVLVFNADNNDTDLFVGLLTRHPNLFRLSDFKVSGKFPCGSTMLNEFFSAKNKEDDRFGTTKIMQSSLLARDFLNNEICLDVLARHFLSKNIAEALNVSTDKPLNGSEIETFKSVYS